MLNDGVNSVSAEILQLTCSKATAEILCGSFYGVDVILRHSAVLAARGLSGSGFKQAEVPRPTKRRTHQHNICCAALPSVQPEPLTYL